MSSPHEALLAAEVAELGLEEEPPPPPIFAACDEAHSAAIASAALASRAIKQRDDLLERS